MPNKNSKKSTKRTSQNKNVKTKKQDTTNKSTNSKKSKNVKKQHPKLKLALKILLVIFLLLCVVGAGIIAAMMFGLFGDDFDITKEELTIGVSNSIVLDKDGNEIANLSSDEKRKVISLSEMPDYLPKAYIAIEDKRFYSHSGVDFKRTFGAILGVATGTDRGGGSSITQQLVKNITDEKARSGLAGIIRKMKEWSKAVQVERMISKDQILELYLNVIFVGGDNIHGVELGATYYFDKSAKNLDLAECAFLAGINSSPNYYNPYKLASSNDTEEKRDERIKSKVLTVLAKMKELGYIQNEEEYNEAVKQAEEGLKFEKAAIATGTTYSYHTDAVIDQVINQVMDEKDISRQLAENYVYSSGLTIHSTVDSTIQARLEEEYAKEKYKKTSPSKKQTTQSGMAIIDYKTGNVVGIAGGLGTKEGAGWNRATQMKKQTGSSIKPIADVAPALEEKVITPATVYDDVKTDFGGGYTPKNDGERYRGIINIRQFIETSQNIPALKIMKELTPEKSIQYLKKMGITSLDDKKDNVLSLAIGGMTDGVSPLEMAAAYGTIANDGIYITPTFYTKVVDSSGNTVLTPKQEQVRAVSEQTAYLTKKITQEPVNSSRGTATYCKISGMDVAAKTGTTDKSYDRWLCGFTPYYSAATWFGYDDSEEVKGFSQNPAGQIWDAVMTDIHKKLANASFQKPSGIVEQTVCRTTGCLATTGCTDTYKEIFASNNIPEKCQGHGSQKLCTESGKVANEYCPETKVNNYGATVPKEQLKLWTPISGKNSSSGTKVEEICDIHKKPEEKPKEPEKPKHNTTNTGSETTTNTGGNTNTSGNTSTGGNTTNTGGNTNTSGTEDPGAET